MKKIFFNLTVCVLLGALLPSCSDDSFEEPHTNLYESTLEHKEGKVVLKFIMPFVIDKIQSGEMADM